MCCLAQRFWFVRGNIRASCGQVPCLPHPPPPCPRAARDARPSSLTALATRVSLLHPQVLRPGRACRSPPLHTHTIGARTCSVGGIFSTETSDTHKYTPPRVRSHSRNGKQQISEERMINEVRHLRLFSTVKLWKLPPWTVYRACSRRFLQTKRTIGADNQVEIRRHFTLPRSCSPTINLSTNKQDIASYMTIYQIIFLSGTVGQWLALLPHRQKVPCSLAGIFLFWGVCLHVCVGSATCHGSQQEMMDE